MLKVTVYQMNSEKMQELYGDPRGAFDNLENRRKWYPQMFDKNGNLKMDAYDVVFDWNIEGYVFFHDVNRANTNLEKLAKLFHLFNDPRERESLEKHFVFTGYSMSVGNVVKLENPRSLQKVSFYYCDSFGWEKFEPVNVPLGFKVGDGATMYIGTDRYPAHISRISESGKTVWIRRADYRRTDKNGYGGSQEYEITPDPDAGEYQVKYSKKYGYWVSNGTQVSLKGASAYQDPHF
jgi:hypothetical protein